MYRLFHFRLVAIPRTLHTASHNAPMKSWLESKLPKLYRDVFGLNPVIAMKNSVVGMFTVGFKVVIKKSHVCVSLIKRWALLSCHYPSLLCSLLLTCWVFCRTVSGCSSDSTSGPSLTELPIQATGEVESWRTWKLIWLVVVSTWVSVLCSWYGTRAEL